ITSMQGSGGGIMVTGSGNQTAFVDCSLTNLYATGSVHDESGDPVCVVGIVGDSTTRPTFHNCDVYDNDSAMYGVVYQENGDSTWTFCEIFDNDSRAADGTIMATAGRATFTDCIIANNESGRGTFYWDAEGALPTDEFRFLNSCFIKNETVTNLYGGVAWVDHASAAGGQPQVMFSGCGFVQNNDLDFPNPTDPEDSELETEADYAIDTPYFPEYRIGTDNSNICGEPGQVLANVEAAGDINSDGSIDHADVDSLLEMLGTCRTDVNASGDIEFGDLVEVLSNFGSTCN
ncbi:MAG: right-handed parallel beta-helix repeat-containing protein, partial [Planctomycetota bacterium]